jgi:hypothetical protein
MSRKLHDALEACLAALEAGAEIEACLALFPDLEDELRAPLEAAEAARILGDVKIGARIDARSKAHLLASADGLRRSPRFFINLPQPVLVGLTVAVVAIVAGAGLFVGSASSLPGEALYPIKRGFEDISLQFAPGDAARQGLIEAYSKRRVDEVLLIHELERSVSVSFEGIVSAIASSRLAVGDIEVLIGTNTVIDDDIAVGNKIEVHGLTQGQDTVLADRVILREFLLSGSVSRIASDNWLIGDNRVEVLSTTIITPGISEGTNVLADVRVENGKIFAVAIFALEPLRAATPTSVPSSTPEPSFESTETREIQSETPEVEEDPSEDDDPPDDGDDEGEDVEFEGTVNSISSSVWVIGGQPVQIDSDTDIEDDPQVGDTVKVKAVQLSDGTLVAEKIEKED